MTTPMSVPEMGNQGRCLVDISAFSALAFAKFRLFESIMKLMNRMKVVPLEGSFGPESFSPILAGRYSVKGGFFSAMPLVQCPVQKEILAKFGRHDEPLSGMWHFYQTPSKNLEKALIVGPAHNPYK